MFFHRPAVARLGGESTGVAGFAFVIPALREEA